MESLRIVIADDQMITRTGLRHLLDSMPDLEIVGEAANGAEAVELAANLEPDVILMDLRTPLINGIEATRRIHRASPHIGILVLTMFEDDTSVFPAIRAGARGYLLKDADQIELLRAIQTVAHGGVIFSAGIAQRVIQYLTAPQPLDRPWAHEHRDRGTAPAQSEDGEQHHLERALEGAGRGSGEAHAAGARGRVRPVERDLRHDSGGFCLTPQKR
jgi:DNA-binding NarL/FixJ family response regulator